MSGLENLPDRGGLGAVPVESGPSGVSAPTDHYFPYWVVVYYRYGDDEKTYEQFHGQWAEVASRNRYDQLYGERHNLRYLSRAVRYGNKFSKHERLDFWRRDKQEIRAAARAEVLRREQSGEAVPDGLDKALYRSPEFRRIVFGIEVA